MRRSALASLVTLLSLAALATRSFLRLSAQSAPQAAVEPWDPSARQVLVRYGITDTAGRTWRGWIEPASGDARVLGLSGYHFSNEDQVTKSDSGASEFSFATRAWTPNVQQVDLSPVLPGPRAVFPNGIYASIGGSAAARFHVFGAGDFTFSLADLDARRQLSFDNGNIEVEEAPHPFALGQSAAAAGEADFPSLAADNAGHVTVVWQEFAGDRDRLVTREWDGAKWSAPEAIETRETADVLRPTAAYDGHGQLHLIWAAQVDGNWDLYERRRSAGAWSAIERLTVEEGSDFNQRVGWLR